MYTIIFDWKQTLYDPDSKTLINGAADLLLFLKQTDTSLILIGKGGQDMEYEVERLDVDTYFDYIIFRDTPKDETLFMPFITKDKPRQTVVIGDRARSEVAIGNRLGATTIWVRQGKFSAEEPEGEQPTFTTSSLQGVKKICAALLQAH